LATLEACIADANQVAVEKLGDDKNEEGDFDSSDDDIDHFDSTAVMMILMTLTAVTMILKKAISELHFIQIKIYINEFLCFII